MKKDICIAFIRRMKTLKTAQAVILAIWAGLNVLIGIVFILQTEAHYFYFFAMNISWNLVNTAVAIFLYMHHNDVFEKQISFLNQMEYQKHIEKSLVFNIGLDLAFIAIGFSMYYYGNIPSAAHPELWVGFGISVIIQGGFLLIQDMIFYRLHRKNQSIVYSYWVEISGKINTTK